MAEYSFYSKFSEYFLSGEYNQFIFSGNIYDIFNCEDNFINLSDFLVKKLSFRRLVAKFNITDGVHFDSTAQRDYFIKTLAENLSIFDTIDERRNWVIKSIAQSRLYPIEGLKLLKEASKINALSKAFNKPFAFIIEHAETLIPESEISRMIETDRQKLVFIRDWLCEDAFIKSQDLIIFVSQTTSEIHKTVVNLPSMANIIIDYPEFDARKTFIDLTIAQMELKTNLTLDKISDLTAGLNLSGIKHILLQNKYAKTPLTEDVILSKTEEAIKGTIGDYIKIINPDHSFDTVLGATNIKKELYRQAKIIKLGNPKIVPRGYLISGRNGVGKTYIMEAFAKELGWLCIELKNLRQKYLGETDVIFERVKNVLESFKNVIVLIDEADTMFGGRGENVHETEKRLTGNFIKMIGDPKNRGKIIWIFITSRPDLLLPDFIRRLEIKFGLFNPAGNDRKDFLRNTLKSAAIEYDSLSHSEQKKLDDTFKDFSPAEFQMLNTQILAEKLLNPSLSIDGLIVLMKRFNLGIGRDKYILQDTLAHEYSTFIDI